MLVAGSSVCHDILAANVNRSELNQTTFSRTWVVEWLYLIQIIFKDYSDLFGDASLPRSLLEFALNTGILSHMIKEFQDQLLKNETIDQFQDFLNHSMSHWEKYFELKKRLLTDYTSTAQECLKSQEERCGLVGGNIYAAVSGQGQELLNCIAELL